MWAGACTEPGGSGSCREAGLNPALWMNCLQYDPSLCLSGSREGQRLLLPDLVPTTWDTRASSSSREGLWDVPSPDWFLSGNGGTEASFFLKVLTEMCSRAVVLWSWDGTRARLARGTSRVQGGAQSFPGCCHSREPWLPALLLPSETAEEMLLSSSFHSVPPVGMRPSSLCGAGLVSHLLPPRVCADLMQSPAPGSREVNSPGQSQPGERNPSPCFSLRSLFGGVAPGLPVVQPGGAEEQTEVGHAKPQDFSGSWESLSL